MGIPYQRVEAKVEKSISQCQLFKALSEVGVPKIGMEPTRIQLNDKMAFTDILGVFYWKNTNNHDSNGFY